MTPRAPEPAEATRRRQAAATQRKRDAGLTRIWLWVPPHLIPAVREAVQKIVDAKKTA